MAFLICRKPTDSQYIYRKQPKFCPRKTLMERFFGVIFNKRERVSLFALPIFEEGKSLSPAYRSLFFQRVHLVLGNLLKGMCIRKERLFDVSRASLDVQNEVNVQFPILILQSYVKTFIFYLLYFVKIEKY